MADRHIYDRLSYAIKAAKKYASRDNKPWYVKRLGTGWIVHHHNPLILRIGEDRVPGYHVEALPNGDDLHYDNGRLAGHNLSGEAGWA
jgi:hypothetical protein